MAMMSVHRSIFFSAVERYVSLLLFFVSTAVLSRLLTPKEFGVYAVINAVTAVIAISFQEFGGANYLIQKATLSERNIRTAFTITFCFSILTGAVLYFFAGVLGWLFSQEGVRLGIAIAVLNFAITPFSTTIIALLRRTLEFGTIAGGNLAGNVVNVVVSIALAALGYSFLAPIWGMIAGSAVQAGYLVAGRKDLRIFLPSLTGYRDVVRFGLYSSGVVLINVFYNSAPQLFLARLLDFAAVGLYSRAVSVTQVFDKLVIQVISPVIMPAIVAQTKSGGDLRRIYLDAISLLTVVHWPFLIFVAVMAQPIIWIWLGPSWLDIVPLIRILCTASLSLSAACLTYPVLVATGSVRDALISSLISLPPSLLLILAAAFFGVEAVAASALLTLPFQAAVAIYFVGRRLNLKPSDLFRAMFKSGIVTVCCGLEVAVCAVLVNCDLLGPVSGLLLACVLATGGWILALIAVEHPLLPKLKVAANSVFPPAWRAGFTDPPNVIRSNTDVC
jgi:O-antigen/teichoic acid export membrane protein